MSDEVTQVDRDYEDEAEAISDDADTGEVVLLFPESHGGAAAELRARMAELQSENQALREQVTELEEFNRDAAYARERVFVRMRRELTSRRRTIEELDAARAAAVSDADEARHRIGEHEALLDERAAELDQAAARIRELEREVEARDSHAAVDEAYRAELEDELDELRAERDQLVERILQREEDLRAAEVARHDAIAELERRHRAELQRLHERAVRAFTLQWLALATS